MSENGSSGSGSETTEELTVTQEKLITALLKPLQIEEAAKEAGISERTAYRWLKLVQFQKALRAGQRRIFDQALSSLMLRVQKAVETLDKHMDDAETPAAVQVRAAQITLDQAFSFYKAQEIEERLIELEQYVKGNNK